MRFTRQELSHLVFLTEVALEGKTRSMLEEAVKCLVYVIKSLPDIELPDDVAAEIRRLISRVEDDLRQENERIREIQRNLRG